jgi:hypothetical protein
LVLLRPLALIGSSRDDRASWEQAVAVADADAGEVAVAVANCFFSSMVGEIQSRQGEIRWFFFQLLANQ